MIYIQLFRQGSTDRAIVLFQMLECISIHAFITTIHHVIVGSRHANGRVDARGKFEGFIATARSNDCVGGSDGRNDVLDYTLSHGICNALDIELLGTSECFLKKPGNVFWVVCVESDVCHSLACTLAIRKLYYLYAPHPKL